MPTDKIECLTIEYKKIKLNRNETIRTHIEKICKNDIMNFISWNKINNRDHFDIGASGIIYKAKWTERDIVIALKAVPVSVETDTDNDEFVKEIKAFHKIGLIHSNNEAIPPVGYENVVKFLGVSSDESELYLVFEYADLGNMRHYLGQNTLNWEQKVNLARQIICGLYFLHENEILHRDLHTQNVVIKMDKSFKDGTRAIIIDFGLSKVLSPIANKIISGAREKPINGTTISFVELYTDCWDGNPNFRPDIKIIYKLMYQKDMIYGEKWKQNPKIYVSDMDQTKPSE
ncbi:37000_t:CDS:2 [Gigaspora margarita]|uniref:37000_t:CDS:1 n=1 Tax=Gigaspora margarita TaxID=4874 RepID=A0ABM8W2S2_GIGMA|nr:37000_t:CDS:2 [Gigaspora margarita]